MSVSNDTWSEKLGEKRIVLHWSSSRNGVQGEMEVLFYYKNDDLIDLSEKEAVAFGKKLKKLKITSAKI